MTVYTTIDGPVGELVAVGEPIEGGVVLSSLSFADRMTVAPGWRRSVSSSGR